MLKVKGSNPGASVSQLTHYDLFFAMRMRDGQEQFYVENRTFVYNHKPHFWKGRAQSIDGLFIHLYEELKI